MSIFDKDKSMPVLNRDEILAVDDIQIELIEVPEWGGAVFVKGMTGAERDRFESGIVRISGDESQVNMVDIRAKLCAATAVDEDGKKLFTAADIKELTKKSAVALQKVYEAATRLSGMSDEDVEELAEGLEESPFEDSAFD